MTTPAVDISINRHTDGVVASTGYTEKASSFLRDLHLSRNVPEFFIFRNPHRAFVVAIQTPGEDLAGRSHACRVTVTPIDLDNLLVAKTSHALEFPLTLRGLPKTLVVITAPAVDLTISIKCDVVETATGHTDHLFEAFDLQINKSQLDIDTEARMKTRRVKRAMCSGTWVGFSCSSILSSSSVSSAVRKPSWPVSFEPNVYTPLFVDHERFLFSALPKPMSSNADGLHQDRALLAYSVSATESVHHHKSLSLVVVKKLLSSSDMQRGSGWKAKEGRHLIFIFSNGSSSSSRFLLEPAATPKDAAGAAPNPKDAVVEAGGAAAPKLAVKGFEAGAAEDPIPKEAAGAELPPIPKAALGAPPPTPKDAVGAPPPIPKEAPPPPPPPPPTPKDAVVVPPPTPKDALPPAAREAMEFPSSA